MFSLHFPTFSLLLQSSSESLWAPSPALAKQWLDYLVPIFCVGCFLIDVTKYQRRRNMRDAAYLAHTWRDTPHQSGGGIVAVCFMEDEPVAATLLHPMGVEEVWQWMTSWRMSVQAGQLLSCLGRPRSRTLGSFYIVMANRHCQLLWI